MDQTQAAFIGDLRADVRHSPRARFRHAVIEDGAIRVARRDEVGPQDLISKVPGPVRIEGLGPIERRVEAQVNLGGAAGAELMAVRTVHVHIRRPAR